MKTFLVVIATLGIVLYNNQAQAQNKDVYNALSSKKLVNIEQQIKSLSASDKTTDKAYTGTLLMTKAGIIKGAGKKLKTFKQGRELLESAITQDNDNGEYRFLRLMIQENAPDILGYNKEMDDDVAIVQKTYANLPKEVKAAIQDYSNQSKLLKASSLK